MIGNKFAADLLGIEKDITTAEHLINVVFPVVKDPKLLVRAFENLFSGIEKNISLVLRFEYLFKRVNLSKDKNVNLETFFKKCLPRYNLSENDGKVIKEIFYLAKKHRDSGFEFSRDSKRIIMDDELGVYSIDKEKMARFLGVGVKLLKNTNSYFKAYF